MKKTALIIALLGGLAVPAVAGAFSMSSSTYSIDDGVINNFGGSGASANYALVSSGGEAFIGPGSSANYRFDAGYVAQLQHSISLSLDALTKTIPAVTPGTSQSASSTVSVFTDAAGYLLSARYDGLLTNTASAGTTIPDVSGTIASPTAWLEGTTKGFGFTISSGTNVEAKWGTNPNYNYAAFTTTDTTIHDKPGYTNYWDDTVIRYRLDVANSQLTGAYRTNVTYSAVVKP
jgi:hypothetical protein